MRRWVFSGLLFAACATVPADMRVTPRYRWSADRGSFRSWSDTTHEIEEFGRETVNNGGKLYWRYGPVDMQTFAPATVKIITEDAKTGAQLAEANIRFEFGGEHVRVAR